jgi:hypothetical protein
MTFNSLSEQDLTELNKLSSIDSFLSLNTPVLNDETIDFVTDNLSHFISFFTLCYKLPVDEEGYTSDEDQPDISHEESYAMPTDFVKINRSHPSHTERTPHANL